jgi:2-C-methyl-D-erythritol 2,4-cyclodiphosphate synthase
MIKVGMGYDIHRLEEGRPLYLGGILIPHPMGLRGHSDGDCLIHALIDALSGAAGLPDIGRQFPDDNSQYKDIRSSRLLEKVFHRLKDSGFRIINIDTIVIAESPRLAPHIPDMQILLAEILDIPPSSLSIKAKTNEGMEAVGRGEAIAAWAVALVEQTE